MTKRVPIKVTHRLACELCRHFYSPTQFKLSKQACRVVNRVIRLRYNVRFVYR